METKNYFITLLLSLFCIPMNAQLKVLSNGKVGIGTTNPQYGFLEIGKSGVNNGLAIYDSSLLTPPLNLIYFWRSGIFEF